MFPAAHELRRFYLLLAADDGREAVAQSLLFGAASSRASSVPNGNTNSYLQSRAEHKDVYAQEQEGTEELGCRCETTVEVIWVSHRFVGRMSLRQPPCSDYSSVRAREQTYLGMSASDFDAQQRSKRGLLEMESRESPSLGWTVV